MQLLPGLYQIGGSLSGLTANQVSGPFDDGNVYAVHVGDHLILIDCGNGETVGQIDENLRTWRLDPAAVTTCLLTHAHYDHAGGGSVLKERGVKFIAHTETADAVLSGDERCCGFLYHKKFKTFQVDQIVEDGQVVSVHGLAIEVIHLPGHTRGCTAFLLHWNGKKVLFSGDVIGTLGYGHFGWDGSIDFDKQLYLRSLLRMAKLDFDIMLPGHGLCSFYNPLERVETSLNEALIQWR
jgi:glyoxylase-like metal-dependent hydrolase (beta-lactamase superfamily II)